MWLSVLRIHLLIPGARSLKDRRQAVRSLKERIKGRFDASVALGDTEATPPKLISAADAALYAVKQNGRNAVKLAV